LATGLMKDSFTLYYFFEVDSIINEEDSTKATIWKSMCSLQLTGRFSEALSNFKRVLSKLCKNSRS